MQSFLVIFIQHLSKNLAFKIKVLKMGIPFCKIQGFPKLSPCYVTNRNSLFKMSVITVEYCDTDGPLNILFRYLFSFVIICLYPNECIWIVSKKTVFIKSMCKLSFKVTQHPRGLTCWETCPDVCVEK